MGRPRKNKVVVVTSENGELMEENTVGIPGLFQPGQWDIDEEFGNNEALRQLRQEQAELGAE